MRRFEFSEGGSQKFWEIDVQGDSFTVRYGRLGTEGQSKTTACKSADEAIATAAKLIREKTKKGYQELGVAEKNWRPPTTYICDSHPTHFMNYAIARFVLDGEEIEDEDGEGSIKCYSTLRDAERRAYAIHSTYDDQMEVPLARFKGLLADPKVSSLKALVIGNWFGEVCDDPPTEYIKLIQENSEKLKNLAGLFVGDTIQEEAEISWLNQCDWSPGIHALPGLEELIIRGGNGLRLTNLHHEKLRGLTIQSGGLSSELVADVAKAKLPSLVNLTLWLGCDSYGGEYKIADLAPILSGEAFPNLEYLGLMNSDQADDIAIAVAKAPVLNKIKGLDLSMGTLSDKGALALLASPSIKNLAYLNVSHNYMSEAVVKQFKSLGIEVDLSDSYGDEEDEEDRYCEVTE